MVIPFNRRFTDEDRDPDLFSRIWERELPGVLNRAVRGHQRVLERGSKFKRPAPVRAATKVWLQQANPLPAFIEAHCIQKPQSRYLVTDFYIAYANWTRAMGYTLTQTQLHLSLHVLLSTLRIFMAPNSSTIICASSWKQNSALLGPSRGPNHLSDNVNYDK
jgi:phage/plasmid-associated DNA primase